MKIDKTTSLLDKIYLLKSLDTSSLEPSNQNPIKVINIFEPTNKTLETRVIYSGIQRDKTVGYTLMYIPDDDKQS